MIGSLRGIVQHIAGRNVTLGVQGVGYEILCSEGCIAELSVDEEVTIIVHTAVREDAITLYGFRDRGERSVFELLLKVSGIGARTASEIISQVAPRELLRIIGEGDVARLQRLKGVGRKTAERMVVELREHVASYVQERVHDHGAAGGHAPRDVKSEAVAALQVLGFAGKEAEEAVGRAQAQGESYDDPGSLVQAALRFF